MPDYVGYVLRDARFICEGCVNDDEHDTETASPVRSGDIDAYVLDCWECGQSRADMLAGADTLEEVSW